MVCVIEEVKIKEADRSMAEGHQIILGTQQVVRVCCSKMMDAGLLDQFYYTHIYQTSLHEGPAGNEG